MFAELCHVFVMAMSCMNERTRWLENARECFRQAADVPDPANMRLLVELGLEYIRMAGPDLMPEAAGGESEVPIRIH
jgi:hypothetical protein